MCDANALNLYSLRVQKPRSPRGDWPQARAYKGELIQFVMAGDAVDTLDIGLNLAFNLRDLGYDHWFVHGGRDNRTCIRLLSALPNAGESR